MGPMGKVSELPGNTNWNSHVTVERNNHKKMAVFSVHRELDEPLWTFSKWSLIPCGLSSFTMLMWRGVFLYPRESRETTGNWNFYGTQAPKWGIERRQKSSLERGRERKEGSRPFPSSPPPPLPSLPSSARPDFSFRPIYHLGARISVNYKKVISRATHCCGNKDRFNFCGTRDLTNWNFSTAEISASFHQHEGCNEYFAGSTNDTNDGSDNYLYQGWT